MDMEKELVGIQLPSNVMVFFKRNFNRDLEKVFVIRRCPLRTVRLLMSSYRKSVRSWRKCPVEVGTHYRGCPLCSLYLYYLIKFCNIPLWRYVAAL